MFITSKLSAIPEIVRSDKIAAANGVDQHGLDGRHHHRHRWPATGCMTKPSPPASSAGGFPPRLCWAWPLCGLITSLFIGRVAQSPIRLGPIPWNSVRPNGPRPRHRCCRSGRCFWQPWAAPISGPSARFRNVNIDQFATKHLGCSRSNNTSACCLAVLTLGHRRRRDAGRRGLARQSRIRVSAVGRHRHRDDVDPDRLPCRAAPPDISLAPATTPVAPCWRSWAITAGLFDIPLQAYLQDRSPAESRGSIMAAYNFLAFAGMLIGLRRLLAAFRPVGIAFADDFLGRRADHRAGDVLHHSPAAV